MFFTLIDNGNAGVTSSFVRKEFPAVDIPLDNEVFAVPKGYNAPQQVSYLYLLFCFDLLQQYIANLI